MLPVRFCGWDEEQDQSKKEPDEMEAKVAVVLRRYLQQGYERTFRKKATGETRKCGDGLGKRRSLALCTVGANLRAQGRCRKAIGEAKESGIEDANDVQEGN
jgi:hypothetical protein